MDMVADQICGSWNTTIIKRELRATMVSSTGTVFTIDSSMSILRLLDCYRDWWRKEQDFGALAPRVPFRDPTSPYIFRLTCQRALPADTFHESPKHLVNFQLCDFSQYVISIRTSFT